MRIILIISILSLLSISCNKEDDPAHDLHAEWTVIATSGGFAGNGYDAVFDLMTIDENFNFKLYDGDDLLSEGKIIEKIKNEMEYLIEFDQTESYTQDFIDLVFDIEKYVSFNSDTLHLTAPCCDRFNTHFVKNN